MASYRKRNGRWQVQIRRVGQSAQTKTFTQKSDAITWANATERMIETGGLSNKLGGRHSLFDLLKRYEVEVLPLKRAGEPESYVLRSLRRHRLAKKILHDITADDFCKLRDERLQSVKASTVRRQFNVLRHALRVAQQQWGWRAPYEAIASVQLPSAEYFHVDRVSDVQLSKLLWHVDQLSNPWIGLSVRLAAYTGLRRGELLSLTWRDLDRDKRRLLIRKSKNGRPRMVPLSSGAMQLLQELSPTAGAIIPISANCLRQGFERARAKAGLTVRFHDLRHEAISRLFERGLTIPEVQLISGHRTLSQLSRYSHPELDSIVSKLG